MKNFTLVKAKVKEKTPVSAKCKGKVNLLDPSVNLLTKLASLPFRPLTSIFWYISPEISISYLDR